MCDLRGEIPQGRRSRRLFLLRPACSGAVPMPLLVALRAELGRLPHAVPLAEPRCDSTRSRDVVLLTCFAIVSFYLSFEPIMGSILF